MPVTHYHEDMYRLVFWALATGLFIAAMFLVVFETGASQ